MPKVPDVIHVTSGQCTNLALWLGPNHGSGKCGLCWRTTNKLRARMQGTARLAGKLLFWQQLEPWPLLKIMREGSPVGEER